MRRLINLAVLCLAAAASVPSLAMNYSGIYSRMAIAVATDGSLRGHYLETLGAGHTCVFNFEGKLAGNSAKISITDQEYGEVYSGLIEFLDGDAKLVFGEARDIPGCGMVLPPELAQGLQLDLLVKTQWIDLREVIGDTITIYEKANAASKVISTLGADAVVGVIAAEGDWLHVSYLDEDNQVIAGWLLKKATREPRGVPF